VVVVEDDVVDGDGPIVDVVVVEVVGVRPFGPTGDLVSHPTINAVRRSPVTTSLRITLAFSERLGVAIANASSSTS